MALEAPVGGAPGHSWAGPGRAPRGAHAAGLGPGEPRPLPGVSPRLLEGAEPPPPSRAWTRVAASTAGVLAGCQAACRANRGRRRQLAAAPTWWPWASDGGSAASSSGFRQPARAERWWSEHPAAGDLLIGWVQHPKLTQDQRVDLEVRFTDASTGVWRSREMNFEGPFQASTRPPREVLLKDSKTELTGTVKGDGLLCGRVRQLDADGGHFELQAMPASYRPWWAQVQAQLKGQSPPSIVIVSPDGRSVADDGSAGRSGRTDEEKGAPASILDSFMGRLFGQASALPEGDGDGMSPQKKARRKSRLSAIADFSMRPDEVKEYLDRYVIKQSAAKEMLAVAICDHYNRAREELSFSAGGDAEPAAAAPRAEGSAASAAAAAPAAGAAPEDAATGAAVGGSVMSVEEVVASLQQLQEATTATGQRDVVEVNLPDPATKAEAKAEVPGGDEPDGDRDLARSAGKPAGDRKAGAAAGVKFTDSDGDVIEMAVKDDDVVQYVNGELEIRSMEYFNVDKEARSYDDEKGQGSFQKDEDLELLEKRTKALFADRATRRKAAAQEARLRSERQERANKNYTKPNILLLGPTGSGKTYLLRNLAQLIGVPFVKADATKFTETGYVGRDSEDLMRDLLTAADGDVELAQVGIVYVDEIDKMSAEGGGGVSTFRRGTQSTFLKLLEDTEVAISRGPPQLPQLMMETGSTTVSTRHVLFVFSGAFSQLDKSLQEKHRQENSGFGFAREAGSADAQCAEGTSFLHKAGTEELVKAGLEPEFVGRIPVRVALGTLSEDDLFAILKDAKDGAASQLVDDFRRYGISLEFTDDALRAVAKLAYKEGTGARALVTVLEGALRRFKFHMPRMVAQGCASLEVTAEVIEQPDQELQKLLDRYPQQTA